MPPATIQYTNLTVGQKSKFLAALATGHRIRVRTFVMDASESSNGREISKHVLTGQVDCSADREPNRWCQLDILDPLHQLSFTEPASAVFGGLWAGSIVRVWYDVLVPDLNAWVATPVFTGPVQTFSRDGAIVHVQLEGKEAFLQAPNHYDNALSGIEATRAGRTIKQALTALLSNVGEPQPLVWQGPGADEKLDQNFDARKEFAAGHRSYLVLANKIIGPHHRFFYDGYGRPVVTPTNVEGALDLTNYLLTGISSSFDISRVRNRVRIVLTTRPPSVETVFIQDNDPLSAKSLGRSGVRRFLDADPPSRKFRKQSDARSAGTRILVQSTNISVKCDVMPIPFLNLGDKAQIRQEGGAPLTFAITAFSFPLHTGDGMSLNYNRQLLDPKHAGSRYKRLKLKHGQGRR